MLLHAASPPPRLCPPFSLVYVQHTPAGCCWLLFIVTSCQFSLISKFRETQGMAWCYSCLSDVQGLGQNCMHQSTQASIGHTDGLTT